MFDPFSLLCMSPLLVVLFECLLDLTTSDYVGYHSAIVPSPGSGNGISKTSKYNIRFGIQPGTFMSSSIVVNSACIATTTSELPASSFIRLRGRVL